MRLQGRLTLTTVQHFSPSFPTSPPTIQCEHHGGCRWWPYSDSQDFESNAVLILIILFCALVCALALNTIIRCILHRHRHNAPKPASSTATALTVAAPTVVFKAGMKLAGAEAECAICLSEFVEGEEIRVLEKCVHGFHVKCIEKWLLERYSCPTCRRSCLVEEVKKDKEVTSGDRRESPEVAEEV